MNETIVTIKLCIMNDVFISNAVKIYNESKYSKKVKHEYI